MQTYRKFRPTACDVAGLGCENQQDWLVLPCGQNRDSGALDRSNFRTAEKILAEVDPNGSDYEVHRFGHWACGWFEVILVRPETAAAKEAEGIEATLADYPILCDSDHSELEQEDANETWRYCFNDAERVEYIRDHRSQFEFRDWADLIGCVRGHYFAGDASSLLG